MAIHYAHIDAIGGRQQEFLERLKAQITIAFRRIYEESGGQGEIVRINCNLICRFHYPSTRQLQAAFVVEIHPTERELPNLCFEIFLSDPQSESFTRNAQTASDTIDGSLDAWNRDNYNATVLAAEPFHCCAGECGQRGNALLAGLLIIFHREATDADAETVEMRVKDLIGDD